MINIIQDDNTNSNENFTPKQKNIIKKEDDYKCVICGLGLKNGVELYVDHIKPKDLGGKATIENGQTLCSKHNIIKKNLKQTESGKKMFIELSDFAKNNNDNELTQFCSDILSVFKKHNVNEYIEWEK